MEPMDEDPDIMVRLKVCDFVNDMAERASEFGLPCLITPQEFLDAAALFEHYITQGATITYTCSNGLTKTVRGK